MKAIALGLMLLFFFVSPALALPNGAIGQVRTLKGSATIIRANITVPAKIGDAVFRGDLIRTSKDSSAGIVLLDETTFSMGPNSEMSLKDYEFEPKSGRFSCVVRMLKGTFAYLSGLIGKLSPSSTRMEVPDATIAVRGTRLLIEVQE